MGEPKLTRREVIGKAVGLGVGAAVSNQAPLINKLGQDFFNAENLQKEIQIVGQRINKRYGLSLDFFQDIEKLLGDRLYEFSVSFKVEASPFVVLTTLLFIEKALFKYPVAMVEKILGGFTIGKNTRNIILGETLGEFVELNKMIYLNSDSAVDLTTESLFDKFFSKDKKARFLRIIHHEIGHSFTMGLNKDLDTSIRDSFWQKIVDNKLQVWWGKKITLPYRGQSVSFTEYAKTNAWEDAADTFATMMTDPKTARLELEKKEELGAKVGVLRDILFKLSEGKMDENYWNDLENGLVNETYWK